MHRSAIRSGASTSSSSSVSGHARRSSSATAMFRPSPSSSPSASGHRQLSAGISPLLLEFQREFAAVIDRPTEGPLRVYRNTVLGGCVDALRANYPIVARLLGDEMFDAVAVDHTTRCPPRRPALALYGEGFSDLLPGQARSLDMAHSPGRCPD